MTNSRAILIGPLLANLIAIGFCLWTALGNDVNICVTTGCSLYQDFSIFGVSLWWYGFGAFSLLAICALLGFSVLGRRLSALFLLGDMALLLLMLLTAPCVSCLVVAVFFCVSYLYFRHSSYMLPKYREGDKRGPSILIWCWLFLFVINASGVVRSQMEIWPILDESGEGKGRMFFSPSCRYCVEGINLLSGNIYMAFYPVADNDSDVYRIARMKELLAQGLSLSDALRQSLDFIAPGFFSFLKPDIMLLRFRLLINKAHVFSAGSQGVPFFEYLGLPPEIRKQIESKSAQSSSAGAGDSGPRETGGGIRDHTLPVEIGGQCGDAFPCPPAN